jgi:hypothetical protein
MLTGVYSGTAYPGRDSRKATHAHLTGGFRLDVVSTPITRQVEVQRIIAGILHLR